MATPDPTLIKELADELGHLRQRGLHNISRKPAIHDKIPNLLRLSAEYASNDNNEATDERGRLTSLLQAAILKIQDRELSEIMAILFGLTENTRSITHAGTLLEVARTMRLHSTGRPVLSTKSLQRLNFRGRAELSEQLLNSVSEVIAKRRWRRPLRRVAESLVRSNQFIARHQLLAEIDQLVDQDINPIVIVGDRGFGKSRLAFEYAHRASSQADGALVINAESLTSIVADVRLISSNYGHTAESVTAENLRLILAELLTHDSIEYLVIDDLSDPSLLSTHFPSQMRSRVLITTNTTIPRLSSHTVEVGRLTDDEARELVVSLMRSDPRITPDRERQIAASFSNRPSAIVSACALISRITDDDAQTLLRANEVEVSAAEALAAGATLADHSLLAVYRQTLAVLDTSDPAAAILLRLVALVGQPRIPAAQLMKAFSGIVPQSNSSSDFLRATFELEALHLTKLNNSEFMTDSLTQDCLRFLYRDHPDVKLTCAALISGFGSKLAEVDPGSVISDDVTTVLPHLYSILTMVAQTTSQIDLEEHDHTLAHVVDGLFQIGAPVAALDLLQAFRFYEIGRPILEKTSRRYWNRLVDSGYVPPSAYVSLKELDRHRSPSPYDIIDYGVHLMGESGPATGIRFLEQEQNTLFARMRRASDLSDYYVIRGEMSLAQSDWAEVEKFIELSSHCIDIIDAKPRSVVRHLRLVVDYRILSRRGDVGGAVSRLHDVYRRESAFKRDNITLCYYGRAVLRARIDTAVQKVRDGRALAPESGYISGLMQLAEAVHRVHLQVEQFRSLRELTYDLTLLQLIYPEIFPQALAEPEAGRSTIPHRTYMYAAQRSTAIAELSVYLSAAENLPLAPGLIPGCVALSNDYYNIVESPYWATKTLLVAFVGQAMAGGKLLDLSTTVEKACRDLGRLDWLASAWDAIAASSIGDQPGLVAALRNRIGH